MKDDQTTHFTTQGFGWSMVDPHWGLALPGAPGEQTRDFHRQRLFCGVAHWGQQAWPAQPEHHSAAQKRWGWKNEEHFAMDTYIYIYMYIYIYCTYIYIYIWQSSQDWLIPNLLIGERTNLKSNLWLFLGVTPPIDSQDSFIQGGHYTCNNIHLYKMNNTEHAPTRKGMRKLPRTADIRFLQRRTAVSKNDL